MNVVEFGAEATEFSVLVLLFKSWLSKHVSYKFETQGVNVSVSLPKLTYLQIHAKWICSSCINWFYPPMEVYPYFLWIFQSLDIKFARQIKRHGAHYKLRKPKVITFYSEFKGQGLLGLLAVLLQWPSSLLANIVDSSYCTPSIKHGPSLRHCCCICQDTGHLAKRQHHRNNNNDRSYALLWRLIKRVKGLPPSDLTKAFKIYRISAQMQMLCHGAGMNFPVLIEPETMWMVQVFYHGAGMSFPVVIGPETMWMVWAKVCFHSNSCCKFLAFCSWSIFRCSNWATRVYCQWSICTTRTIYWGNLIPWSLVYTSDWWGQTLSLWEIRRS